MGRDPTGHSLEAPGFICPGLVLPQQLGLILSLFKHRKTPQNLQKETRKKNGVQATPPSPPCPPSLPPSTFPAPVTGTPSATPHRAPAGPPSSPRALRARSSGAAAAPKRPEADAAGNADGHGPGAASLGAAGLPLTTRNCGETNREHDCPNSKSWDLGFQILETAIANHSKSPNYP